MATGRFGNLISVSVFGGVNILNRGTTTILALILALRLDPAELGAYAIVAGIAEVAGILGDAGVSQAMIRNYYDRHAEPGSDRYLAEVIFTARLLGLVLLAVLAGVAALCWGALTGGVVPLWPYLPLAFGLAFFNRIGLMVNSLCQALQRPLEYGLFSLVQMVATIVFTFVFVFVLDWRTPGALGGVLAALVVANLVRMVVMARILKPAYPLIGIAGVRDLLSYGVPLLPKQLAIWGRQMALRLVLAHLVPVGAVGAFFFANSVASTLAMATTALEPAFTPLYMKKRVAGADAFHDRVLRFLTAVLGILVPVYAAGVLLSGDVAHRLLPHGYGSALPLIPLLFLNLFFQTQEPFMTKQLVYHKRTGMASLLTVTPIAMALASLALVVPAFGLAGAAWAMAIANAVVLVLLQIAVTRLEPSDYPARPALVAGVTMIALAAFVSATPTVSPGLALLATRVALTALVAVASFALLIWPNRGLLHRLSGLKG